MLPQDWEQGPGSRYLSSIWRAVLVPGIESDYCVQCFNWPWRHTWADQNHMCVCGLAAEELPLAHIVRSALCMLKLFFPHSFGWCNATSTHGTFSLSKQFWHDVYYSAVMETDVEQWNFVFPKANLFNSVFQQDSGEEWNLPAVPPNVNSGLWAKYGRRVDC